jgi:peroxiredoxin (alkyl hydroperoxide reductase subunit C)
MNSAHEAPVEPTEEQGARIPLIGESAPAFEAVTTQGPILFPDDYREK